MKNFDELKRVNISCEDCNQNHICEHYHDGFKPCTWGYFLKNPDKLRRKPDGQEKR